MRIARAGEAALIDLFRRTGSLGAKGEPPGTLRGIGDDAAVLDLAGSPTLVSADLLIEGVHFERSTITAYQLGYKSVMVNVSDIRAMAGRARFLFLSLGLPADLEMSELEEFARGVGDAADRTGCGVVGGDTCRSGHGLFVGVTVIGSADRPLLRRGARPGDGVFVTGTLGDSGLGLMLLSRFGRRFVLDGSEADNPPAPFDRPDLSSRALRLIRRHVLPEAVMTEHAGATACIDLSDGLLIDLGRLCDESGVGVRLWAEAVPVSEDARAAAPLLGCDVLECALSGGEDYQLLFTAPAGSRYDDAVQVGEILPRGREILSAGAVRPFPEQAGYDHFGGET